MINRDFTLPVYKQLIIKFLNVGYAIQTFEEYLNSTVNKVIILRHDVDRYPENALKMAQLECEQYIKSSYYFRIVRESNRPEIIQEIAALGHEIGYHYEDLTLAKGDYEKAFESFKINLKYFRQFYPVKTICMHGSPLSKWDNHVIWDKYNYKDYYITGEPYFDVDYKLVAYLTDTGRKWNSNAENVRDKVQSAFNINCHSTFDMIDNIRRDKLPDQIMINVHPQRWSNNIIRWMNEFVIQKTKNMLKKHLITRSL